MIWVFISEIFPNRVRAKGQALDVSAVRFLISGGASLPVETLRTAEETWGVPLREGFGISEGSGAVSFMRRQSFAARSGERLRSPRITSCRKFGLFKPSIAEKRR